MESVSYLGVADQARPMSCFDLLQVSVEVEDTVESKIVRMWNII